MADYRWPGSEEISMTVSLRLGFLVAIAVFFALTLGAKLSEGGALGRPPEGVNVAASTDSSSKGTAMSDMPGMRVGTEATAPFQQPWCQDNAWSTFNHRVSGWFLLLWGLTAFAAGIEWPRRTWRRYLAPMVLFSLAEFLFFRNDPEAWPVGPMTFWASLHDAEDLQHRIFLLLIVLIALVELLRAAGRLAPFLAKYALPALGTFGAVYLFFHKHGGSVMAEMMNHAVENGIAATASMQQMTASMSLVRHEHLWISMIGFGLVAAKLLGDTGRLKGRWGSSLWPVFAILLGAYLTGYTE